MSDEIGQDLESKIEGLLNDSDESTDDSEFDSDTEADESNDDSATGEADDASESESDELDDSDTDSDVEFDFHNTSTSITNLVNKLKALPEAERNERISKITREKELAAVKEAFPDVFLDDAPVSRKEYKALQERLEEMSRLQNPDELKRALEIAQKLNATESMTDSKYKSLLLQEQFGENAKEVANDIKFMAAYEKFPTLSIEERLSYACSMSNVAKKLATETEIQKQVRLQNTKTVQKGRQTTSSNKLTAKDVDSADKFEQLLKEKYDG